MGRFWRRYSHGGINWDGFGGGITMEVINESVLGGVVAKEAVNSTVTRQACWEA